MIRAIVGAAFFIVACSASAQQAPTVPVTVDNFSRAETDTYIGVIFKRIGLGKFFHHRTFPSVEDKNVRPNRDTYYSEAIFDLDVGPVAVTLPDAGARFMSFIVINEDHYVPTVYYGRGTYKLTRQNVGTRYVFAAVRTLVNPLDPKDVEQAHRLQDAMKIDQPNGPGRFDVPNWDQASQKKVRDALKALGETIPDFRHAFGRKDEVNPIRHLIGTSAAWGGNPDKDAIYLNVTPRNNDGSGVYKLVVPAKVPVDGFWSITLYDGEGFFQQNPFNAYSFNSITAKKNADGTATIQFGGCDGKIPNCLPITKGWNYTVRLYRPRSEILNGKWKFAEAKPAS